MEALFKPEFVNKYKKLLGDEWEEFLEFSSSSPLPSIRVNTLKISSERLEDRLRDKGYGLQEVPWYRDSYHVFKPRRGLGNTVEHSLGYFYIQDSASMIPPLILNLRRHQKVLDLCASPGSKTTQIAQIMGDTGMIVANDSQRHRMAPLLSNLQRCGVTNTLVTRMDGTKISEKISEEFNRVLVDAPCSGSGVIRKRPEIAKEWSSQCIKGLSKLQKRLVIHGFQSLKRGGILVYSTCSLDPEEDEGVIHHLLREKSNCQVEKVRLSGLETKEGLTHWDGERYPYQVGDSVRIYPQDNDTIGFFLCKVRKI
ncbi:MAG: RsmB/NOP family class I SAM-dependent RNA methyltransferase [Thermoproteota archaeon]